MNDVDFEAGQIPAETLGDRMRRAMKRSDVTVNEMADHLGIDRQSVSRYLNDRVTPRTQTLRLWALRCGVPYTWLVTGDTAGSVDSQLTVTFARTGLAA